MSGRLTAFRGARLFDGAELHEDRALLVRDGAIEGLLPPQDLPAEAEVVTLDGGVLAPGYLDLQVNGGGGVMLNDAPSVATLTTIARAHAGLGATAILPTLITDTAATTRATVDAVERAIAEGVPGIVGLHLEGPHLSLARKGAHDPTLIRPMAVEDLAFLVEAAGRLPVLMVTLAPESASPAQLRALTAAGAIVSLGHSDAAFADCRAAAESGARCVTHLFNAMSQLGNREPGLVGAALGLGALSAGLIADLIHVHPATIAAALAAKRGPGRIFLVSDSMAGAGSDLDHFVLNGRRIERREGRLTLEDGTLAGADLDLTTAVRNLVRDVGLPLAEALAMATSVPARVIGREDRLGRIAPGLPADFLWLDEGCALGAVWQAGVRLES